jgi:hypothetical protein
MFIAKTWNNGSHHPSGAGYGLKILLQDREQFFNRSWQTVILHLAGYERPIEVNVAKESFWNRTCGELISKDIGIWLQRNNRNRWDNGSPHEVRFTVVDEGAFRVEFLN